MNVTVLLPVGISVIAMLAGMTDARQPVRIDLPTDCMHAEQGNCYIATMDFGESGDKLTGNRSMLVLLEDGKPLGPARSAHADIRTQGGGRYSHWTRASLYFSTSDNSDPRTNGRTYSVTSRNPNSTMGGLQRFSAVRKDHVERISTHQHTYHINVGGTLDMDNTRTLTTNNCYIAFQNNLELTVENTGAVPVKNPRLVINDRGNWYTFASLLEEFTHGARTDQERVYLIWENMRQNLYHETPLFGNAEPHDPVRLFNAFGFNLCDDAGNAGCSLFYHAGFRGSKNRALNGHVQCEAEVNNKLQFMDVDMDCFYLDRENKLPVGGDPCARDHDLVRRELNYGPVVAQFTPSDAPAALFGPDDRLYDARLRGHEIAYTLRPSEKAVFRWDNIGKYCAENEQRSHRPKYFGNSKFVFRPRLTLADIRRDAVAWQALQDVTDGSGGKHVRGVSPNAFVVYAINTPYPICGGSVHAVITGQAAHDRTDIAVALDGKNWQTAWSRTGAGRADTTIELDKQLDIHTAPAKYRYYVRVGLASNNTHLGSELERLEITTNVLAAPVSLPRLCVGNNSVRYWDETQASHEITVTHRWQESNAVTPLTPPAAPKYPADDATIGDSMVTFQWPQVADAARYHIRVSRHPELLYPYRTSLDVIIPTAHWTVPFTGIFSPDTQYYWRVRCCDHWGVWGPWSDTWTFAWDGPRVPIDIGYRIDGPEIELTWKPNPRGPRAVAFDVYGSDEKGFSIHRSEHSVPGRGTVSANYLGRTTKIWMPIVGPTQNAPAANRVFYRVVAIDDKGTESGCSDFVELPHPFVFSKPAARVHIGQAVDYTIRSLRSLGDYQCKPDAGSKQKQYAYRFWDTEKLEYKLLKAPDWLSIDARSGRLIGTPKTAGSAHVAVRVSTESGNRVDCEIRMTVE